MSSFYELFKGRTLESVFADQTPVPFSDPRLQWLHVPPSDLLRYAVERETLPFDGVPPDEVNFKKHPTFFIAQAHRIWLMLDTVMRYFDGAKGKQLYDLGAFPFSVDIALREYAGYQCRIVGLVNDELPDYVMPHIEKRRIEFGYVNLDPLVRVNRMLPWLSDRILEPDHSIDFIIFSHVIEHLYHPLMTIRECFRALKRGGRMMVATDSGYLLRGLIHYLQIGEFLHDPVDSTAAMAYHTWRGHVRYYTEGDLRKLFESAGFRVLECEFREVLYNAFFPDYFHNPPASMPEWQAELLTQVPAYRNEVIMVVEKP